MILIDNGSEKKTSSGLQEYAVKKENIQIITNAENLGFPKAINQGLRIAQGKYIVIANNDIIFTKNWLTKMISHAETEKSIGIIGPVSNNVSGVQRVKNATYRSPSELSEFAKTIETQFYKQKFEFPRVAFLCTLIKREVIEKVGALDERFSPGNYEDDDYCLRAQLAGFKTVIALDVFIHHYGSASFTAEGNEKYRKLLETNRKKFIEKWGATPDEIWLKKTAKLKDAEINIPIEPNNFAELVNKANEAIQVNNLVQAKSFLEKALENFDETAGIKKEQLEELLNKINAALKLQAQKS